jgi:hypothetical protein
LVGRIHYASKKIVENAKLYKINLFEQNPASEYVAGAGDSYVNSLLVDTMENRFLFATYPTPAIERSSPGTGNLPFYSPQTYLGGQIRELNEIAIEYDVTNSNKYLGQNKLDFQIKRLDYNSFQITSLKPGKFNLMVSDISGRIQTNSKFENSTIINTEFNPFMIYNFLIRSNQGELWSKKILLY